MAVAHVPASHDVLGGSGRWLPLLSTLPTAEEEESENAALVDEGRLGSTVIELGLERPAPETRIDAVPMNYDTNHPKVVTNRKT